MKKVLCKNCACWDSKADGSGYCRKHAPGPQVMPRIEGEKMEYVLVVPSTMANDGCFEGRDVAEDAS